MEGTPYPKTRPSRNRGTAWSLGPKNTRPGVAGVVAGRRYYSPGLGRWTSRDPIGEKGGPGLYAAFALRPVDRVDPYGDVVSFTQDPTDTNGNRNAADWPTVKPDNRKALAYAHTKVDQPPFDYDHTWFLFWCKLSNLKTGGRAKIIIGSGIAPDLPTPGNPSRTVLQHEQAHVDNFKQGLVDFDTYAAPAFIGRWECCSCTDAKVFWVNKLWDYFQRLTAEKNAQLECSDYAGVEKTHACQVTLPAATASRLSAYTAQLQAFSAMSSACGL